MPGVRCIDYRELKSQVEKLGAPQTVRHLTEALETNKLAPRDFSIRELAESFMGPEWVQNLHPKSGRYVDPIEVREAAGDAVAYSHFSRITGQIFFTEVKQNFELEEATFSKIIPTVPSTILDREKIPGISDIGDEFTVIGENGEYPNFGVSEDYIEVAEKRKRGGIVNVTKEAIFGDKTGVLLDRCRGLGKYLGLNREKRLIDCVIDENAGAVSVTAGGHRYHWRGTSYATYQTTTPWDNVATSNGLVDESDLEQAWLTLIQITDPFTGEPVLQSPKHLVVTPQNLMAAHRAIRATEVRTHAGGYPVTGNPIETVSPPGLRGVPGLQNLQIVYSQLLAARAATDTDWWLGDLSRAFAYYSCWEIETEEQAANSEAAFRRDVVMAFKAREMGTAATKEPRVIVESRA